LRFHDIMLFQMMPLFKNCTIFCS